MPVSGPVQPQATQSRYRRFVFVCLALAGVCLIAFSFVAFRSANEFTQPEGIVATQTTTFAHEGTLYYSLKQYPYTVCAYMPVFYTLAAGLIKAGLPALIGARILSIAALGLILWLSYQLVLLFTGERLYAQLAVAMLGISQLLLSWGTTGQVDTLTVALALASFYCFARFQVLGEERLDLAAGLAIAALFTKQTALAAPAAIFLFLLFTAPKRALRFAAIVAGLGGVLVLGLDRLLDGRFLANTVFANMNPFAWYKLGMALEYAGAVISPVVLVALVAAPQSWRTPARSLYIYLALAAGVFFLTAPKVGADSNYLIESTILLIVCAAVGLEKLRFFELSSIGSKSLITLLILPISVYAVQNLRVSTSALISRIARETQFAAQVEGVRPYIPSGSRVLCTDSNALLRAGRYMEVEPLIYRLLVEAGRIEPTAVLEDIDQRKFATIILYEDVARTGDPDPEIPRLTAPQMDAIRRQYQLIRHVPGPYLGGLFIYQPRTLSAQGN